MIEKFLNLFGIGRITLVDDTGDLQTVQVTEGAVGHGVGDRVTNDVRRVTEFGFASVPPLGSEVLLARRNGRRSQSTAIATSHRPSRPRNLQPGDCGIYDVRGARISLTGDGLIIDCAGLPAIVRNASTIALIATDRVTIDAPNVQITHDLAVGGSVTAQGNLVGQAIYGREGEIELGALHDAYDGHAHGGVKAGADTSGLTNQKV